MSHKVLFIEAGSGQGGSSIYLSYLLKYLDKQKFNPLLAFYYDCNGPDIAKIRNNGIEILHLGMRRQRENSSRMPPNLWAKSKAYISFVQELLNAYLPVIFRLTKLISKRDIDLVFLNNDVHYHIPGVIAAKIARRPCICRKAGIGGGKKLKNLLSPLIDVFVPISEATRDDCLSNGLHIQKLAPVVYPGVDLEEYNPSTNGENIRKQLEIPSDAKVIASISRLDPTKGQSQLLDAVPAITKNYPQSVFLIIGEDVDNRGQLLKSLKKKATQLGINKKVRFTGWMSDIPSILAGTDVFVQNPTYPEGLGVANLEAMAMAKPTVVTHMGGLCEATLHNVTGFVIPPDDPESLAESLYTLLTSPEKALEMGKNARKRVEEKFDISRNVKEIEEIFRKFLCTGGPNNGSTK